MSDSAERREYKRRWDRENRPDRGRQFLMGVERDAELARTFASGEGTNRIVKGKVVWYPEGAHPRSGGKYRDPEARREYQNAWDFLRRPSHKARFFRASKSANSAHATLPDENE
jgi:hypothetical protein